MSSLKRSNLGINKKNPLILAKKTPCFRQEVLYLTGSGPIPLRLSTGSRLRGISAASIFFYFKEAASTFPNEKTFLLWNVLSYNWQ